MNKYLYYYYYYSFISPSVSQNADAYIAQNKVNRNTKNTKKGQSKLHTIVSELSGDIANMSFSITDGGKFFYLPL